MTIENTMTANTGAAPVVTDVQITVESPIVPMEAAPVSESSAPAEVPADPVVTTAEPAKPITPDWAQKRINELTAKRYEAERTASQERDARLAAEAQKVELLKRLEKEGASPDLTKASETMTEEEINKRANAKAIQISQQNEFNKACNSIVETGKKEFTDWDEAVKNLSLVGAIGANVSPEFLETAIELKSPHKILHYLGSNLEEAEKLIKMPPKRMAMEMARIESAINAPKPVIVAPPAPISAAPAPVIPVGGAAKPGTPDINDSSLSSEDWHKLRQQQIIDKRNRYRRA